jgi:hypothetical protein
MLTILTTLSCVAVWASSAHAAQDWYYKTKADEKAGRMTQGRAPQGVAEVPNVGGDACSAAVPMNPGVGATFSDTGTTVGANDTVTAVQAGCEEYTTTAGPDVIYTFSLGPLASRGTPLTITLTPNTPAYDPAIYTLSTAGVGCPAGTANSVTNCVNGSDSGFAGGQEQITDGETDAMPAGTYFLFVDSFYNTAAGSGNYTLAFGVGPLPVELIDFTLE